ncbi:alpha/beta fold hydrolase [Antrihabitans cavernicola]|uniref:Alpha/beta hydrolase n=1 Tax=Antrihabitans cavernicola TaxID=2495913 RepID=A0A5A7S679_9NOCA|nr:alpha/beta hydrolase [Spelaeibacter cavernicola]KAA0021396.1 alpha/beta hydrolase [Spelaeibacter cavernicola]
MLSVAAIDGTEIQAVDEGAGPVLLIVHGGMGDSSAWAKVAAQLVPRFRVVRLHRRQYRLDLTPSEPVSMAQEVTDVLRLVERIGEPILLVGHSSGAVVALEAVVAAPESFVGLVAYEPPAVIGPPLGGAGVRDAWTAYDAGKSGKAMAIFDRTVMEGSRALALLLRVLVGCVPRIRAFVPRQLADTDAIDDLGDRRAAYATITVPTVFLAGDRSPAHLGRRLAALQAVMPTATKVVLPREGHNGNDGDPRRVAEIIESFATRVFGR